MLPIDECVQAIHQSAEVVVPQQIGFQALLGEPYATHHSAYRKALPDVWDVRMSGTLAQVRVGLKRAQHLLLLPPGAFAPLVV